MPSPRGPGRAWSASLDFTCVSPGKMSECERNEDAQMNSSKEFLGDRRVALEEAFFAKQNEALRQRLREKDEARLKKEAFSAASGITDDVVLEKLIALNIGGDTLAALSLVPLVAVAWADGGIDSKERNAVLSGAAEVGVSDQDASYQLLDRWLAEQPSPELLATWKDYISALSATLSQEFRRALKEQLLGRARTVAEAAGGFMGVGRKVSISEENVLEELEAAFSK